MTSMTRIRHWAVAVAVAGIGVVSAGCLVKDSSSTLILEPGGAVRWVVTERNIHAVADTPADRLREEEDYMGLAATGTHPVATAFLALGGQEIRTAASSDWPFTVVTDARFPDVARLWQDYFDRMHVPATSRIERSGTRTTWTLVVTIGGDEPDASDEDGLGALIEGDDRPTFVIRHGEFVEAVGFAISDDGRVAKMDDLEKRDWEKDPQLVLKLSWVGTEAASSRSPR